MCEYKKQNGTMYDLRLMDIKAVNDLSFVTPSGDSVYFRSCGYVRNPSCSHTSSVCIVSSTGKALDFGSFRHLQFADGVQEMGTSVEATFGNGETCSNGVPRKTLVQYTCNLQSPQTRITRVDYTDCYLQIFVESAHACSSSEFCGSQISRSACENQEGYCSWSRNNTCVARSGAGCIFSHYFSGHHGSVLGPIILLSFMAILLSLSICLCLCACRSKRIRAARVARQKKVVQEKQSKKISKVPYQQVPVLELVPGGFAPVNPYAFQGYPMVQLVAPTQTPESDSV